MPLRKDKGETKHRDHHAGELWSEKDSSRCTFRAPKGRGLGREKKVKDTCKLEVDQ